MLLWFESGLHKQHCESFTHPEQAASRFQNPQQFTTRGALTQGIQSMVPNPMRRPTSAAFIDMPYCDCLPTRPSQRRTVTKAGENAGKTFYTCKHKRGSDANCGFFEWAEESAPASPTSRSPPMRKKKRQQPSGPAVAGHGQAHKRPKGKGPHKRPNGRTPKGKMWDAAAGMWVIKDIVAIAAASEAMARVEERESALLDVPITVADDDDPNRAAVSGSWMGPPAAATPWEPLNLMPIEPGTLSQGGVPGTWRQASMTTPARTPQACAAIERQNAAAALTAVQAFPVAGGGSASLILGYRKKQLASAGAGGASAMSVANVRIAEMQAQLAASEFREQQARDRALQAETDTIHGLDTADGLTQAEYEQMLASAGAGGDTDSNALVECRHCEDFIELGELDGHERTCPNRPHTAAEETEPCILCSLPIPVSKMNAHVNACLDKA